VTDANGAPIGGIAVIAGDEITGESFPRSTDGNGYADVAMLGSCKVGDRVTLTVFDPQLRFKGFVLGDALVITAEDQVLSYTLQASFRKPTRAQVCLVRHHFQGLMIQSRTYGPLPWFTAALGAMARVGELDDVLTQLLAAGDTHCQTDLTFSYGESGQPYGTPQLVPDCDLSNDLPTWLGIIDRVRQRGLIPIYVLPCGGQPGLAWLHGNLQRIVDALGPARLAGGLFQLEYDGAWPASWSVTQVQSILPFVRSIIGPTAHLGMMFANGPAGSPYLYVQDEGDYSKDWMQCLDVILTSTWPNQVQCPALPNYAQYMIGPALTPQGVCTPDWHGPFIMAPETPRGPFYWGVGEWNEYNFVRVGAPLVPSIDADRARIRALNIQVF